MSNYDKYEEEINVFTLLWFVLSKWKSILIVAVIGLVLGAGYAAMSVPSGSEVADATESTEQAVESLESVVAEQTYETMLARVESLEKYIAEAAIMEMNPYELYRGTAIYVIDDTYKDLAGLNTAIYSYVWDGTLMADLEKVGPYTAAELDYLLGLTQGASSQMVTNESAMGQVTARISIFAQDKVEAQKLLEQIDSSMRAYLDTLLYEQDITSYKLKSIGYRETVSTAVADYQANMRSKYETEKTNLDTYNADLGTVSATEVAADGGIGKTMLIKYGGVGFVGGIIVAAVIWILIYFLCGKLYTVSDKGRRFGVKQLGTIYDYSKLKGIDLWIGHKLGGVYSNLPIEEQKNVVLLNVKNELEKDDSIKKVFLVSSLGSTIIDDFNLKAGLESAGYQVEGCEKVIGRADVLKHVTQCDAVVVVEDNINSRTIVVEEEVDILKAYSKKILGMIVTVKKF